MAELQQLASSLGVSESTVTTDLIASETASVQVNDTTINEEVGVEERMVVQKGLPDGVYSKEMIF